MGSFKELKPLSNVEVAKYAKGAVMPINPERRCSTRCGDDRFLNVDGSRSPRAVFGGNAGDLGVGLEAMRRVLKRPLSVGEMDGVTEVLSRCLSNVGVRFGVHTDETNDRPHDPTCKCAYCLNSSRSPEAIGLDPSEGRYMRKVLCNLDRLGVPVRVDVLRGEHAPRAAFVVHSLHYTLGNRAQLDGVDNGDTQAFVVHATLRDGFHKGFANQLGRAFGLGGGQVAESLKTVADSQTKATLKAVAPNLKPIQLVIDERGDSNILY